MKINVKIIDQQYTTVKMLDFKNVFHMRFIPQEYTKMEEIWM